MKLNELLINISYSPFLIGLTRFFHLRGVMRRIYYRLISPKNKVFSIEIKGSRGDFYVRTPLELRSVGVLLMKSGPGERMVLEKMIEALSIGDVAYDIGANLGIHTIFMAKHLGNNGKVVAFEPESGSYNALLDNIKLNDLNNVVPMQLALGDKISEAKLYWKNGVVGSYGLSSSSGDTVVNQKVKVMPGDLIAKELNIAPPKVVKIDVEGYEYSVILGMKSVLSSEACHMVSCEIHPKMLPEGVNPDMIFELLRSYGFVRFDYPLSRKTFNLFCYKK